MHRLTIIVALGALACCGCTRATRNDSSITPSECSIGTEEQFQVHTAPGPVLSLCAEGPNTLIVVCATKGGVEIRRVKCGLATQSMVVHGELTCIEWSMRGSRVAIGVRQDKPYRLVGYSLDFPSWTLRKDIELPLEDTADGTDGSELLDVECLEDLSTIWLAWGKGAYHVKDGVVAEKLNVPRTALSLRTRAGSPDELICGDSDGDIWVVSGGMLAPTFNAGMFIECVRPLPEGRLLVVGQESAYVPGGIPLRVFSISGERLWSRDCDSGIHILTDYLYMHASSSRIQKVTLEGRIVASYDVPPGLLSAMAVVRGGSGGLLLGYKSGDVFEIES